MPDIEAIRECKMMMHAHQLSCKVGESFRDTVVVLCVPYAVPDLLVYNV